MPEAVIRLNAYNTAVAKGVQPPPISGNGKIEMSSVLPSGVPLSSVSILNTQSEEAIASKPHREIYVGNLPPGISVPQLAEFINAALKQMGFNKDGNSVVTAWVSPDGHFAFAEVKTVEEANAALIHLNGIQIGMYSLKVGRPKGYNANGGGSSLAVPMQGAIPFTQNPLGIAGLANNITPSVQSYNPLLAALGLINTSSSEVLSHVIMVSNLPALISEDQIKELFTPFGELKAFNLIKAPTGSSQSAVFEYVNHDLTDHVVDGMNKLDLGGTKLSVQRVPMSSASLLLKPTVVSESQSLSSKSTDMLQPTTSSLSYEEEKLQVYPQSCVIRLSNMTTQEDLEDDVLYEELIEDVAEECNTKATVRSVVIPRQSTEYPDSVGKIFVFFTDKEGADRALKAVIGRKFNGNIVQGVFYPEDLYLSKVYQSFNSIFFLIILNNVSFF